MFCLYFQIRNFWARRYTICKKREKFSRNSMKNDQNCAVFDPRVAMGRKLSISNRKRIALDLQKIAVPKKVVQNRGPVSAVRWGRPAGREFSCFLSLCRFGNNTLKRVKNKKCRCCQKKRVVATRLTYVSRFATNDKK